MDARSAERNLRLYPLYVAGFSFFAWTPVFFLYFASRVSVAEVLRLEAIYYASVFLLEVPSGYFSDRFGRRITLRISALLLTIAYAAFFFAASFEALALAQVFLAAGLAFNSGTDTSFHLANLEALGKEAEYAKREASLSSLGLILYAAAALAGGAAANYELRFAYGLAGAAAAIALLATLGFARASEERGAGPFFNTLRECADAARSSKLGWFFALAVSAIVINHIPYEFYQPYLEALDELPREQTPLIAGVHVAAVQLLAVPAAKWSHVLAKRLGIRFHLLLALAIQVVLIGLMALYTAPWVAILLLARSLPRALQGAPLVAEVNPHLPSRLRATYLSLQSLAGRILFAITLVGLSLSDSIGAALSWSTGIAVALLLLLIVSSRTRE